MLLAALKKAAFAVLYVVYPARCIFCHEFIRGGASICPRCAGSLPFLSGGAAKQKVEFAQGCMAALSYEGVVSDSIRRFKFEGCWHYARPYAKLLAARLAGAGYPDCDLCTYVPVSLRRRMKRRYDQAELLAAELSKETDIPLGRMVLKKIRHNQPQSQTPRAGRSANVLGAYAVNDPEEIRGKTILLIDDVTTTGATLSECARVLLTAGADRVYCAAFARALLEGHAQPTTHA